MENSKNKIKSKPYGQSFVVTSEERYTHLPIGEGHDTEDTYIGIEWGDISFPLNCMICQVIIIRRKKRENHVKRSF